MKRAISVLLVLAMLMLWVPAGALASPEGEGTLRALSAGEESAVPSEKEEAVPEPGEETDPVLMAETYTSGDFSYALSGDEATVTAWSGSGESLEIPAALDGHPVTVIGPQAFQGNTNLEEVVLPASVTMVDNLAFRDCTALERISLPDSLTSIHYNVFRNCDALTEITIPRGVKDSGGYWFEDCDGLTRIVLEEGSTEVPYLALAYLPGSPEIVLPDTVTAIREQAFRDCFYLEEIVIPDSVTELEDQAFLNCRALEAIELPEGLTEIAAGLFQGCSALQEIEIPEGVETLCEQAFRDCSALERVSLPDSLTSIRYNAFRNCDALTEITIPRGVKDSGGYWFEDCDGLTRIALEEGSTEVLYLALAYLPGSPEIVLPDTVTAIRAEAFRDCFCLEELKLPDGVTEVENNAFLNCRVLEAVELPKGLTEIAAGLFRGCTALKEIEIPEGVETLCEQAFRDCTALERVSLPDSLSSIRYNVFRNCDALTEITIPRGVKDSGGYWFEDCDGLKKIVLEEGSTEVPYLALAYLPGSPEIVLPDTVTAIRAEAFRDCFYLEEIVIPDGVTELEDHAFLNCRALEAIELPEGLTEIAAGLFRGCLALQEIEIPEGVETLCEQAFRDCTALERVSLPESLVSIRYNAFRNCDALTEITIPRGVKDSGGYWFEDCDGLTRIVLEEGSTEVLYQALAYLPGSPEIVLPNTVTAIRAEAFRDCFYLEEIVIPDGVTELEDHAFLNCRALETVELPEGLTKITAGLFRGCTALQEIEIPEGVEILYEQAFRDCTALERVSLPESLVSIRYNVFRNCDALTEITIPRGVKDSGGYWFEDCDGLTRIALEEGSTEVLYLAMAYLPGSPEIVLPDTVTAIRAEAFRDCFYLEEIVIPDGVTEVEYNAFLNCGELTLVCGGGSEAMRAALQSGISFRLTGDRLPEAKLLDRSGSRFAINSGGTSSSGYIDFVLDYLLLESVREEAADMTLEVTLPDDLVILENTVKAEGESCDYSYLDGCLQIPVGAPSGRIRFSAVPESTDALTAAVAVLSFSLGGEQGRDLLGYVYSQKPLLTLEAPFTTNRADIRVSGVAPAESTVLFRVDEEEAGSAVTAKNGYYSAVLRLPAPEDGHSCRISARTETEDGLLENSASVLFDAAAPVVEELLMHYYGHDERMQYFHRTLDLTGGEEGMQIITFNPNYEYTFTVKMSHPEQVDRLFITSTRNGVTKYIEALWNEAAGLFVTSDKFDGSNTAYVPGEIGVSFSQVRSLNWSDADAVFEELTGNYQDSFDFSGVEIDVISAEDDSYVCAATLPDENRIELSYETMTPKEFCAYLREIGFGGDASLQEDAGEKEPSVLEVLLDRFVFTDDVIKEMFGPLDSDEEFLMKLFLEECKDVVWDGSRYVYGTILGSEQEQDSLTTVVFDTAESTFRKYVIKSAARELTLDYVTQQLGDEAGELAGDYFGFVWGAGKAMIKFGSTMQSISDNPALSEYDRRQMEGIATFVLFGRFFVAGLKTAAKFQLVENPVGWAFLTVSAMLLSDVLDQLEANGWEGLEDSLLFGLLLCWIIDPSGYVYEAVTTNRLEGAKATAYYRDPATGTRVKWDASEYSQTNPLITGMDGLYAWDTPEGEWQVEVELEGCETWTSEWLPVPPPQTEVNAAMVSYAPPRAEWVNVYADGVEILFSKYMQPETVSALRLAGPGDEVIGCTLDYDGTEQSGDGTVYARLFRLVPEKALTVGETYGVSVPEGVLSYAGVAAAPTELSAVCREKLVISAPVRVSVACGETFTLPVTVSQAEEDAVLCAVSAFDELVEVLSAEKTGEDLWTVTATGRLPGETAILCSVPGTAAERNVVVTVRGAESAEEPELGLYAGVRGGAILYSVTAPAGTAATLFAVSYDGRGRMLDYRMLRDVPADGEISGLTEGAEYRVILAEAASLRPLCEALTLQP